MSEMVNGIIASFSLPLLIQTLGEDRLYLESLLLFRCDL